MDFIIGVVALPLGIHPHSLTRLSHRTIIMSLSVMYKTENYTEVALQQRLATSTLKQRIWSAHHCLVPSEPQHLRPGVGIADN